MKFFLQPMLLHFLILFIIVFGTHYTQEIKENHKFIDNVENEKQFYCEAICFKNHPFGVETKCGHKFCISCLYKLRDENPSLCAYCRNPLSNGIIDDYLFIDINVKKIDNIEIENLQNSFPILPYLPETTCEDISRWLDNYQIDINFVCPLNGATALFFAAYSGNFNIFKFLVDQGAKTDYFNKNEMSAFHFATKHNLEIIKYFLKQLKVNVNQNGKSGSPLMWASRFGNVEIVEYLILNEADVNLKSLGNKFSVYTPLIQASFYGHLKIIETLIFHGADVNLFTEDGCSALHASAQGGHLEICKYLIKQGAIYQNSKNGTPLLWASMFGNIKIVEYLILNGADVNLKSFESNKTALIVASFHGHLKIIKYLIYDGADINILTKDGCSALHAAAEAGHFEICKYLIKKGAKVNEKTKHGSFPHDFAFVYGHAVLADFLFQNHIISLK